MERRVQKTNGYREAVHSPEYCLEVASLHREYLSERVLSLLSRLRYYHLADSGYSILCKEHVLGTAEAYALRAELLSLLSVARRIGVRSYLHRSYLVYPAHKRAEVAGHFSRFGLYLAEVNVTRRTVYRNIIALLYNRIAYAEASVIVIYFYISAARYAARAHTARDDRRVRGHTASCCENAFSGLHTLDILGRGLETNEHGLLAVFSSGYAVLGGEVYLTASGAGRRCETLREYFCVLKRGSYERRVEQRIELLGIDLHYSLFLGYHTFGNQINRDLYSGRGRSLTVTRLEHIEFTVFDGILHILHIFIVLFKLISNIYELSVNLGHIFLELSYRLRRSYARDDVLALRVYKVFAEQLLLARSRIASERDARAGRVAHVTEYHSLYVYRRAP